MMSDNKVTDNTSSDKTVAIVAICLVILVVLLIILYKKLNRDTDGQYTVRRMVYKKGGLRDRARGAVTVLENRLGMQLWPRATAEDYGDEMQEIEDDEARVERGSRGGESEGEEEEEEGGGEMRSNGDDSSDDYSSLEGSDLRERAVLKDHQGAEGETEGKMEGKGERKSESAEDGEGKEEASGGAGLLIDLKQFSGSAIWSEEKRIEDNDVTAL